MIGCCGGGVGTCSTVPGGELGGTVISMVPPFGFPMVRIDPAAWPAGTVTASVVLAVPGWPGGGR